MFEQPFSKATSTGNYRCRASNQCGGRCPNEKRCSLEDVIGDEVNLKASERDSDLVAQYFLNPVINNCWYVIFCGGGGVRDRNC